MLLASQKMDWGTMAGFGLGKLLRDGFNSWKGRYDARDEIKGSLAGKSPEEQERQLKLMQEYNPAMYQNVMKYEDQWRAPSNTANSPPPDLPSINQDAHALKQGLLGSETAFSPENTVEQPFSLNTDNWNDKFNLEEAIRRLGWGGR